MRVHIINEVKNIDDCEIVEIKLVKMFLSVWMHIIVRISILSLVR